MLIGVDLLWVRPGINGGTESVIRNLLKAFGEIGEEDFLLFVSRDNEESFRCYADNPNMKLKLCGVDSGNPMKRVLWQNAHLDSLARNSKVDVMFSPVYSTPRHKKGRIPYVSVIHDMQALHYPEYFGKIRNIFFRASWKNTCRKAAQVITISDYCKAEIIAFYPDVAGRITRIYDPVDIKISDDDTSRGAAGTGSVSGEPDGAESRDAIYKKYGVKCGGYDYCVSSLLPHKNLDTLLRMKAQFRDGAVPLLISGVGGRADEFNARIRQLGLEDLVFQTGFVSNEERDILYKGCRLFLFPSVFEGFGMPPIEALAMGKRVVMTQEACLREVTGDMAVYVEKPFDPAEWNEKIAYALSLDEKVVTFPEYDPKTVAGEYLQVFRKAVMP